jgi:hemolysin III
MQHRYYADGELKPFFRGFLHMLSLFFFPITLFPIFYFCENLNEIIGVLIYKISMGLTLLFSSLFHIGDWSLNTERKLQSIDHANIILDCTLGWFPFAFIYLKDTNFILIISLITIILYIYLAFISSKNKSLCYILACSSVMFYMKDIIPLLTTFEIVNVVLIYTFYISGLIIYHTKILDFFPTIFGYHEVFHVLTVGAFLCTYLTNLSLVIRN